MSADEYHPMYKSCLASLSILNRSNQLLALRSSVRMCLSAICLFYRKFMWESVYMGARVGLGAISYTVSLKNLKKLDTDNDNILRK